MSNDIKEFETNIRDMFIKYNKSTDLKNLFSVDIHSRFEYKKITIHIFEDNHISTIYEPTFEKAFKVALEYLEKYFEEKLNNE